MKYKYAILVGLSSLLSGFIPLSFTKPKDIVFTIYTTSLNKANLIKEELINFYKTWSYFQGSHAPYTELFLKYNFAGHTVLL